MDAGAARCLTQVPSSPLLLQQEHQQGSERGPYWAGRGRRGRPDRGGCGRRRSHRQTAWPARARSRCRRAPTPPSPSRCPPPSPLSAHHMDCAPAVSALQMASMQPCMQGNKSQAQLAPVAAGVHACRWGVRLATTCLQASITAAAVDSLAVLLQLGPARKAK